MFRIRELRKAKKITAKQLAEHVNVAESTMCLYETGKREPDYATLIAISEYFNVSVDYLLGKDPEPQKEKPAEDDGLSPNRRKLIDWARSVPEEKVEQVYSVIQSILEALK